MKGKESVHEPDQNHQQNKLEGYIEELDRPSMKLPTTYMGEGKVQSNYIKKKLAQNQSSPTPTFSNINFIYLDLQLKVEIVVK